MTSIMEGPHVADEMNAITLLLFTLLLLHLAAEFLPQKRNSFEPQKFKKNRKISHICTNGTVLTLNNSPLIPLTFLLGPPSEVLQCFFVSNSCDDTFIAV